LVVAHIGGISVRGKLLGEIMGLEIVQIGMQHPHRSNRIISQLAKLPFEARDDFGNLILHRAGVGRGNELCYLFLAEKLTQCIRYAYPYLRLAVHIPNVLHF
jgi:hypothetical protein